MHDASPNAFQLGNWLVDPDLDRLTSGEESARLEPKTMEVLVYLCERPGEVVSAEEIIAKVWGGRPMGDTRYTSRSQNFAGPSMTTRTTRST